MREGIPSNKVCFVGNVMIDSVVYSLTNARRVEDILNSFKASTSILSYPPGYGVVTLHRPSNVDDPETFRALLTVLNEVATRLPLVFALHPRTRANIDRFGLTDLIDSCRMVLLPPQGYLEMLGLLEGATVVLTDSGGLQEETTALGVPCLTLRENTERPITVEQGSNTVVGRNREVILDALKEILAGKGKRGRVPEYWDGHASERLIADLYQWLKHRQVGTAAQPTIR